MIKDREERCSHLHSYVYDLCKIYKVHIYLSHTNENFKSLKNKLKNHHHEVSMKVKVQALKLNRLMCIVLQ